MDFELGCARSCQGNQPARNPPTNGLPRGPIPRGPLGTAAGMAPAMAPPTHGFAAPTRRPYQGFPTHPHNPLLSQISQNPLISQQAHPQSLQMGGGLFAEDPVGHLQGAGPSQRRGPAPAGVPSGALSTPWAAAHLNGLAQMGQQRMAGSNLVTNQMPHHGGQMSHQATWEDQLRYMQPSLQGPRGLTRDAVGGGGGPAGQRSRAPTRSTSAGNLHDPSMLVRVDGLPLHACSCV